MSSSIIRSTGSDMYELARSIGAQVFHPNYYSGPWRIHIRGKVKICSNHITANAWAKYFIRRGFQASIDNIYLSKENNAREEEASCPAA